MCARPIDEPSHHLAQSPAESRERVLYARRHLGIHLARNQTVALHAAQSHRQHPLTNPIHSVPQLVESQRACVAEEVDYVPRPLISHTRQHLARVAVGSGVLQLRRLLKWRFSHGYSEVPGAPSRAFFYAAKVPHMLMIVTNSNLI